MSARLWPADAVTGAPSYTGRALRQTTVAPFVAMGSSARPLGAKSGARLGTPASIVSATSTTWTVQPFVGVIDGEAAAIAGPYNYSFDTNQTGAVTAAAGSARIDRLDVQVSDPAESDGSSTPAVTIVYTAGVAGSGVAAAAPARSHRLCLINVPASGGGSPTVSWAPDWSDNSGEWTFNTVAERDAYVTAISSANVPPQQQATILADPLAANNVTFVWSGTGWRTLTGLILLKPTASTGGTINSDGSVSFSAASSVAVDGIFSATFDNYVIIVDQTTSSANTNWQYIERASGTDNVSTYFWSVIFSASTSVGAAQGLHPDSAMLLTAQTATYRHTRFEVAHPADAAVRTMVIADDASTDTSAMGNSRGTGWHGIPATYDGFKLISTAGTVTGKLRIYGISNS